MLRNVCSGAMLLPICALFNGCGMLQPLHGSRNQLGTDGDLANLRSRTQSSFRYDKEKALYIAGNAILQNTPSITGSVNSFSVSPALPAGMSLDTQTGVIS